MKKTNQTNNTSRKNYGKNSQVSREEIEKQNNDQRNIPVLVITYFVVVLFIAMICHLIIFVARDAEVAIANSYNKRQSLYAEKVVKGQILSSDGEVLAETLVDGDGNETRYYPYANMFAHAVGYDTHGQAGLEMLSTYYLLTSNQNIITRVYNTLSEQKNIGNNVVATLDYSLQSKAYNALGSNNGAVVIIEPDTGKILTMVSKPDFNPNNIDSIIAETQDKESSYLLNRVTQGMYPPGSTFKVLTALEYIRENQSYVNYSYNCEAEDMFSGVPIHCYNYKVHGEVDLKDSLAYSCNTSFSNLGLSLDMGSFRNLCETFLFNNDLPYDGYYSKSSFVLGAGADRTLIPQTVIGQGQTLISPLHNALIMCVIANGGVLMKPYMIDHIENCDGNLVKKFSPNTYGRVISADEAAIMTDLLTGVTEYGTASAWFDGSSYTIAGKTGTAEFNENKDSHSWFVGFSNVDHPDIVVCVIVENASSTGTSATAIARELFDCYYQER